MPPIEKTLEVIQIELGKLRAEMDDLKTNHLKHLSDSIKWCNVKTNFILVLMGVILGGMGLMIAMLALHIGE